MAPVKFSFSNLQLLQLLHEHLVLSGLLESAEVLQKEAKLEPLVDIGKQQQPVYPVGSMISFNPSDLSHRHSRPEQQDEEKREELSLTSLVSSKLTEQFKTCKKCRTDRTLTTAIVRDLLLPHKCPPRSRRQQERNVTERFFMSQTGTARNVDKRTVYSRFWPVKTLRTEDTIQSTGLAFSGDGECILTAIYCQEEDHHGYIKVFNLKTGRQTKHWGGTDDDVRIWDIQTFQGSNLVLTSADSDPLDCRIWTLDGEALQQKLTFTEERYLDFSKLSDDKVVGTCEDGVTSVWDLKDGQCTRRLVPTNVEHDSDNRATFNPTDQMILSASVLWDVRMSSEVHRFGGVARTGGVFHPYRSEVVIDTKVFDLRTFQVVQEVPWLKPVINRDYERPVIRGEVFYTNGDDIHSNPGEYFRTFDTHDYKLVSKTWTDGEVSSVAPSWDNFSLAVTEEKFADKICVQLYDVGSVQGELTSRQRPRESNLDASEDEDDDISH